MFIGQPAEELANSVHLHRAVQQGACELPNGHIS